MLTGGNRKEKLRNKLCFIIFSMYHFFDLRLLTTPLLSSIFSYYFLWFSPVTPVSSTNKTDRPDIAEILLKVALNTINLNVLFLMYYLY